MFLDVTEDDELRAHARSGIGVLKIGLGVLVGNLLTGVAGAVIYWIVWELIH